jgi:YVTN family beta-propeller protein
VGKKLLDYVIRRFNASSAGMKKWGWTYARTAALRDRQIQLEPRDFRSETAVQAPSEEVSSFRADLGQSTSSKETFMKNRKNYVMTKSNVTLTQSGLLAVLLQRQRHKVFMRCASRERFNKESKPNMKTLIMTILFAFAFASSALAQSLFVAARYSDEVAVIDTSTNQVVTQIAVGRFPIRIAMTPNRLKAFVSDGLSASISVLDTVAHTNTAAVPVSAVPGESAVTPDGGRLFVLHQGGLHGNCPVDVIDTATNLVITTVIIPGHWAKDILFTPDGRFAYIANFSNGEVDVIDTTSYQVTNIPTGGGSRRLCISPAGDRVYVANYKGDSVPAIDTATKQLIATIPVGQRPMGIAITPNGEEVYVGNVRDGTVSVIDTTTLTVIATIPTGNQPQRVVIFA